MKYYEKAVENYAKARKEFYARALKKDIMRFNQAVERMTADGECPGFECEHCPVRLAFEAGIEAASCGVSTPQERREAIARETKE